MLETDPPKPSSISAKLRALVVDGNDQRRTEIEQRLHSQGVRVHGCATVDHGRELFDDHALVIMPINGDNEEVLEFVSWLRTRAGRIQPYVMGLGEYRAPASEWHGFNEFVSPPFQEGKVVATVEAALRWHGWNIGVSLLTQSNVTAAPGPEKDLAEEANPAEAPVTAKPVLDVTEIFASVPPVNLVPAETGTSKKSVHDTSATATPDAGNAVAARPIKDFDWSDAEKEEQSQHPTEVKSPPPSLEPLARNPQGSNLSSELKLVMTPGVKPEMTSHLHQQITEASPFGLLMLDDSANLIYANPQHRNVLGLSVDAAGGLQGWLERGCVAEPGQQRAIIESWYEQVWRRRLPMVMTMRSAESLLKEIEFRPSALSDERLLIAIFDVTDARREEESMRASEARFRNLFLQAPLGVVVVNAVGNITDASLLFEQMVGCSRLDMRRLGMDHFFTDAALNSLRKMSFSARAGMPVAPIGIDVKSRDGEILPVLCDLRIVKNSQGAPAFTAYYLTPKSDPATAMPLPSKSAVSEKPNLLLQAVPDLVLELSADGIIISHLPTRDFVDLLPPHREIVGQPFGKAFATLMEMVPWQEMMQNLQDSLDAEVRCEFCYRILPGDPPRYCEARMVQLVALGDVANHRFGLFIHDLTRSRESKPTRSIPGEERPEASYEFSAITLMQQAAIVTNEKGRICNLNPAAEALFGYEKSELMGGGLYKLFLPEQPKEFAQKISDHINRHRCWIGKSSFFRKDGTVGRVAVELVPFDDHGSKGFLGLMRDITGEEAPPTQIKSVPSESSVEAPMVTLHRARNDLQVLSSLLSLQANDAGLTDSARHALQEGKDRVAAVALIYKLVNSTTGLVNFNQFAAELSGQILRSHQVADGRIQVKTAHEAAPLKQKLALNLGLILQELLTSVVAHSFPGGTGGTIEIQLELTGNDGVLRLKDDGTFPSETVRADREKSVGWKVVEALSQQIHGELKILSDLVNEIQLRFKLDSSDQS